MICSALTSIGLPARALAHGAAVDEMPKVRELTLPELEVMHCGKDASINNMLVGGNGFPASPYNFRGTAVFDAGCTQEKRDVRSMLVWSQDLEQCKRDKAKGAEA